MSCRSLFIFFFIICSTCSSYSFPKEYIKRLLSFAQHEVVPDVLETPPGVLLQVHFPDGASALEGNELTLDDVAYQPTLLWEADPDRFYSVIMCDADAPSRENPEARCFLHWLVINVPGSEVEHGDTVVTFLSSHPEPETGLHRYIFLVYQQPESTTFDELPDSSFEGRVGFSPEQFAAKFGLDITAGNFYQTQTID